MKLVHGDVALYYVKSNQWVKVLMAVDFHKHKFIKNMNSVAFIKGKGMHIYMHRSW